MAHPTEENFMKTLNSALVALSMTLVAGTALADERVGAVSVSTLGAAASGSMAIAKSMPAFPVAATRNGNDFGRVVLSYDVAADGTVKDVQVLSANPVQVFTRSAISAVEKWRYLPGASDKRTVEFTFVRE